MQELIYYLAIINIITFLLFMSDKKRAIRRQWRVPEILLLSLSAIGGSLGGYLSMQIFRHKTKTAIFKVGMPILIILQAAALIYYIKLL